MRMPQGLTAGVFVIGAAYASADEALGTFTVKGHTTRLVHAYLSMDTDPEDPGRKYLVAILSDLPVPPADRRADRLLALARAKQVRALKVRWGYGLDDVACVPYHADVAESGRTHRGYMILDLTALDEKKVRAHVRSKMLGQDWHFDARVEGALRPGGVAELEPPADEASPPADTADEDPVRRLKRALGGMGYEATPEGFDYAVRAGNAEAVRLFLEAGMDPNTRDSRGDHVLFTAVAFCAHGPAEARQDVVLALLRGGSDVNEGKGKNALTLIWAAQHCSPKVVEAMIAAGAEVNSRAPGGATPLMMTRFRQDGLGEEIAAMLRQAGAQE
jgi:hypothetical protein